MKWSVLLLTILLSACTQEIAAYGPAVMSPSAALEHANQLNGTVVRIRGFVVRGYGNACLYDNAKFADAPAVSVRDPHALAVLIPRDQIERFKIADHRMVTVSGRFKSAAGTGEIVVDICSIPFVEMQSFQLSH